MPEPNSEIEYWQSTSEAIAASTRSFELQLALLGLQKDYLQGKQVLNIGSGLSNFIDEANKLKDTCCVGIDPIYSAVQRSSDFTEFNKFIKSLGVTTEGVGVGPYRPHPQEVYSDLKKQLVDSPSNYIGEKIQDVILPSASQDVILACQSVTLLPDDVFQISLNKMFGWLKDNGQISIYPFYTASYKYATDLKTTLEGFYYMSNGREKKPMNERDKGKYFSTLKELAQKGANIYTFADKDPVKIEEVPTHSVLVIRKDSKRPIIEKRGWDTYHYGEVIKIDPLNTEQSTEGTLISSTLIQ